MRFLYILLLPHAKFTILTYMNEQEILNENSIFCRHT